MGEIKFKRAFVGADNYIEALNYYYVDKTLFIRDIINRPAKVLLITRPRRFGKTLNMDMLKIFFERTNEDTSEYFRDKKIWSCGDDYSDEQGQYPVVFISFKDAKALTWEKTYSIITDIVAEEFLRHKELRNSGRLLPEDIEKYKRIVNKSAREDEYRNSIRFLTKILNQHWNGETKQKDRKEPIVLIDEYDAPVHSGFENGYDKQIMDFMKGLFSAGLKDNPNLNFAVLTGVLRIPKESLFSDLNNFKEFSVLDKTYSEYFGFTQEEVKDMLAYYRAEDKYSEVCRWYDGYMFGDTVVFNPWSVLNYIVDGFIPKCSWVDTGRNALVGRMINNVTADVFGKINLAE